jgi:hypothetical protein
MKHFTHCYAMGLVVALLLALPTNISASDILGQGFTNPPAQTKPWCYYYWISGNVSKEGITRDLEAMAHAGIGEALIGNIFLDDVAPGKVKVTSEEWWQLVEHAIREGGRVGVNIGLFNCAGWSQSGGPWIKPEQTMRYLTSSETCVTGPIHFSQQLAQPKAQFQDVAVLAFPAPQNDSDTLTAKSPRVTCTPSATNVASLVDGNLNSAFEFPEGKSLQLEINLDQPLTARTLQLTPAEKPFSTDAELQAERADGTFETVRRFKCDWSNQALAVGFIKDAPVTISFPAVTAKHFRLILTNITPGQRNFVPSKGAALAEINLSGTARLESFVEKQLGKMLPNPFPKWDSYLWSPSAEPDSKQLVVPVSGVRNLSSLLATNGTLTWDVPPGNWLILRTGMTPTGMSNSPAPPEAKGLEVDKMNRKLAQRHFDAFIGQLLKRMPASDRKAFTRVVADSYETGAENWTDDFAKIFQRRYGYDPKPWLPVLTGRIVGSADQSDRFLWDMRRLVADRVATEYVGGLRAASEANGLGLWLENYGHWGFPSEFLKYGSESDRISGEFWVAGELGSIECRCASSCANTYGKKFVSAESFTGGPAFQNSPRELKARGDWSFCEGVNHVMLHVYIHQPWDDKLPGVNAPWGTEFNRNNTWFEQGKAWIDYERRCCWLLQQGWRAVDVAYFIGEDTPKMTGERNPKLPAGFDFDYINADVIENSFAVKQGQLVLPHGVSYRILVLPKLVTMRPEVLKKIRDLIKAGATVLGEPPLQSPSLENFPKCDQEVRRLAAEIWGGSTLAQTGEHTLGKGRIIWGKSLDEVFAENQTPPDIEYREAAPDANFLYTHRHAPDADIYFISNQKDQAEKVDCAFRVASEQPELWNAVTGERRILSEWSERAGETIVPLEFAPNQSWFVVFRQPGKPVANDARNFPELKTVATLAGPWDLSFDPQWGGPTQVSFAQLADWSTRPEEGIQHYSGKAVYRKTFDLPDSALRTPHSALLLDLGDVRDLATVRVNGKYLGTIWTAPWQVDISSVAKTGLNTLEIEVINPWNNRLAGDAALPTNQRRTFITLPSVTKDTPLLPAGLLGPVKIYSSRSKTD